jgi:hypothetical protein
MTFNKFDSANTMNAALTVMIIVLACCAVGLGVLVWQLALRANKLNIRSKSTCDQQAVFVVGAYRLCAASNGISLMTDLTLGSNPSVPYVLTYIGIDSNSTVVASPMIAGAVPSRRDPYPNTPPPPLAAFDLSKANIKDLQDFNTNVTVRTPIGNVAQLALLSFDITPGISVDAVFLCTADGVPLVVLGGLVNNGDVLPYTLGMMPLSTMFGSKNVPGFAMLNVHPSLPIVGYVNPAIKDSSIEVDSAPTSVHSTDRSSPFALSCLYDPDYQTQTQKLTDNVNESAPPLTQNIVMGCSQWMVPAMDMVDPKTWQTANTRSYIDAIAPFDAVKSPVSYGTEFTTKVGTTGWMGVARLRQWTTDPSSIGKILQDSNPEIVNVAGKMPYVTGVVPVPQQYATPGKNAVSLMFGSTSAPFTLTQNENLCNAAVTNSTRGAYVADPGICHEGTERPNDEAILVLNNRASMKSVGNQMFTSPPTFVIGFGMDSGNIYLGTTKVCTSVSATDVNNVDATCATCTLPSLTARTACWPVYSAPPDDAYSNPSVSTLTDGATAFPIRTSVDSPNPPYVAVGACVGTPTVLDGGHASRVMPWKPMMSVPTGDESHLGFGRYYGLDNPPDANTQATNAIWYSQPGPAVHGFCR